MNSIQPIKKNGITTKQSSDVCLKVNHPIQNIKLNFKIVLNTHCFTIFVWICSKSLRAAQYILHIVFMWIVYSHRNNHSQIWKCCFVEIKFWMRIMFCLFVLEKKNTHTLNNISECFIPFFWHDADDKFLSYFILYYFFSSGRKNRKSHIFMYCNGLATCHNFFDIIFFILFNISLQFFCAFLFVHTETGGEFFRTVLSTNNFFFSI